MAVSEDTTYQERPAFAVAETVLGVTAEPFDRDGRQRAVDALLHYPGGGQPRWKYLRPALTMRRRSSTSSASAVTPGSFPG